jgi:hypothetical protein
MTDIPFIQRADVTQLYFPESIVVTELDRGSHNIHDHDFIAIKDILSNLRENAKTGMFVTGGCRISGYARHTLRFDDRRVMETS